MRFSQLYIESGVTSSGSCRLCLRTVLSSTPIFTEGETFERLRACILDCCPITLFKDDQLPNMICDDCERKVAATYEFRERCRESEHKLRSLYDSSYSCAARRAPSPYQKTTVRDRSVQTDHRTCDQPTGGVSIDSEEQNSRINEDEVSRQNVRAKCWMNGTGDADEFEGGIVGDKSESCERSERNEEKKKRTIESYVEEYCLHASSKPVRHSPSEEAAIVADRADQPLKVTDNDTGKRYLCDVCSKTFASKSGLRFHLKSHIGAKPHLCRYCGKGFAIPSYAKRHERIHTGDKRFVCQFCSAAFASSNGLKYHLRSHTGEANYRCETCGKAFNRHKYLKEHVFTHTGEKPFVCKTCGLAYGNSGSLFVHEKKCKTREECA